MLTKSDQPTPEPDGTAKLSDEGRLEELYPIMAAQMENGATDAQIRIMLFDKGFGREAADEMIANLKQNAGEEQTKEANKDFFIGLVFCLGGLGITSYTYDNPDSDGSYVWAWGPVLFGLILILRALSQAGPPQES